MLHAGLDDISISESDSSLNVDSIRIANGAAAARAVAGRALTAPRRTPRKSLIVVLPENHTISTEALSERLQRTGEHELVDVIVACAGQPTDLANITRRVRDVQILLAPAGTSQADLRELAMRQSPGDIVTLLSGSLAVPMRRESEMFGAS